MYLVLPFFLVIASPEAIHWTQNIADATRPSCIAHEQDAVSSFRLDAAMAIVVGRPLQLQYKNPPHEQSSETHSRASRQLLDERILKLESLNENFAG